MLRALLHRRNELGQRAYQLAIANQGGHARVVAHLLDLVSVDDAVVVGPRDARDGVLVQLEFLPKQLDPVLALGFRANLKVNRHPDRGDHENDGDDRGEQLDRQIGDLAGKHHVDQN